MLGGVAREPAAHHLVWLKKGVPPPPGVDGEEWLKRGVLRLEVALPSFVTCPGEVGGNA
jgi:hypothetical protein